MATEYDTALTRGHRGATYLAEICDVEALERQVGEQWILTQTDGRLTIYNYSPAAQARRYWTPETRLCRGLIVDQDGRVVARPFPKFFNLGEHAPGEIPPSGFDVFGKADGSLGIGYVHPADGQFRIATRGSLKSPMAVEAKRIADEKYPGWQPPEGVTPLFEIIYPENRIVVNYGDMRDLVLLAAIDITTGADVPTQDIGWPGPEAEKLEGFETLDQLAKWMEENPRRNHEGYVLRFWRDDQPALRVKLKYREYVELHRAVHGIDEKRVWEVQAVERMLAQGMSPTQAVQRLHISHLLVGEIAKGLSLATLRDSLPEELWDWFDETVENNQTRIDELRDQYLSWVDEIVAEHGTERRTLAKVFAEHPAKQSHLFAAFDRKPGWEAVLWTEIRPESRQGPASLLRLGEDN